MAVKTVHYKNATFSISYEILNPSHSSDIIFLHGWGSNKNLMKQAFSKTLPAFRHIYIDMPGFGGSNCDIALETIDYSAIMELFLEEISAHKNVILGHSFGGKVATLLNPKFLVLVASAGILVPKPLKVRIKISLFKILKFTRLTALRSFFVAPDAQGMSEYMYQTFKNVVNEDFTERFKAYKGKALLCFGKTDTATPLWTGEVIHTLITNSRLVAYEGEHYFLLKEGTSIAREIEQSMDKKEY
ncbi:MAG: alpha/beta hydrolase [Sulfuricurvum sp.]|nr:alpha/beta hydrolase [Sulfuricurvum sp.]